MSDAPDPRARPPAGPTSPPFEPRPAAAPTAGAAVPAWPALRPTWPPTPAAAPRRGFRRLAALVLAAAVLGTGGYASARLLLADDRGAASPEEAGERLLEAIDGADLVGVIELLPDGERQLLLDVTGSIEDEGERLRLLDDAFRLDGFPGLDLRIADAELDVQPLADGLATVTVIDGTASYQVDGDRLIGSVGAAVEAVAEANDVDLDADDASGEIDIGELRDELTDGGIGADPFTIVVVEDRGRWFPSVAFTIAEWARRDAIATGGDATTAPDLDDGIEPDGGRDPLDAVQDLLDAAVEADGESMVELLDPGELGALQVYAHVLFGDLTTGEETGVTLEITDAEVRSLGDGVHRVVPTGVVGEVDLGDVQVRVTLEDGCVSAVETSGDEELDLDVELCDDDVASLPDELGEEFEDVDVPQSLIDLVDAFAPLEAGIITVERDGDHFVSPIRTFFDLLLAPVRGLEPEDVAEGGIVHEALTGGLDDEIAAFFDELGEGFDEQLDDLEEEFPSPGDDDDEDDDEGDESSDVPVRPATGASGPNGEVLVGDVVAGELPAGGLVTFTVVGSAGEGYIGAQTLADADLTIRVRDAATGEELDFSDDFVGTDPEAFVVVAEGQVLTVDVAGFGEEDGGPFVVYYER